LIWRKKDEKSDLLIGFASSGVGSMRAEGN
jgi:hypothetical protein